MLAHACVGFKQQPRSAIRCRVRIARIRNRSAGDDKERTAISLRTNEKRDNIDFTVQVQ